MKVNNYGEGGGGEERDRKWINDLIQSNAKNNWEGWTGVKRGGAVVGDVRWGVEGRTLGWVVVKLYSRSSSNEPATEQLKLRAYCWPWYSMVQQTSDRLNLMLASAWTTIKIR